MIRAKDILFEAFRMCILSWTFGLLPVNSHSQSLNPTIVQYSTPKSPNFEQMQKHLELPNNLNTGQPGVNIPVYSITAGDIHIPINLNYSSTGFKMDDIPSWVGMGWNLEVGGFINRKVVGLPDDEPSVGIYSHYSEIENCLNNTMSNIDRYQFYWEIAEGNIDTQFDEYTFSFLGRSGKFYIDKQGVPVCLPKSNLRISYSKPNRIETFTITDENAIVYQFDIKSNSISDSYNSVLFAGGYYNYQTGTTWVLTKVLLPNGQDILFSYDETGLTYTKSFQSVVVQRNDYPACVDGETFSNPLFYVSSPEYLIKSIVWKDGHIDFIRGDIRTDIKQLDPSINLPFLSSIKVFDNKEQLRKFVKFKFTQGNRLVLKGVQYMNLADSSVVNEYKFKYVSEAQSWPSLNRNSNKYNAQDYWGYFNGVEQQSMIPTHLLRYYFAWNTYYHPNGYSSDRNPNSSFSGYGMLEEIEYPTGGKTNFEYEPNKITYQSFNDVPLLLKSAVPITYQTVYEGQVQTNGTTETNASLTQSFSLSNNVEQARITFIETNNDPTSFANTAASISSFPGTNDPNICNCGNVATTTSPYSYAYTRQFNADLLQGNYDVSLLASSYDAYYATSYAKVEIPVHANFTVEIGGMRVKKTTFTAGAGSQNLVRKYEYDFTGDDQVNIKYLPVFINTVEKEVTDGGCPTCCRVCTYPQISISSNSVSPMPGFHLQYPKVVETVGENAENGRIIHYFSNTGFIGGGFLSKPFGNPAELNWIGGLEYKSVTQTRMLSNEFSDVRIEQFSNAGDSSTNLSGFDMNLIVGVKKTNKCSGYPALLFPTSNSEAANAIAESFSVEFVPVYTEYYNRVSQTTTHLSESAYIDMAKRFDYTSANPILASSVSSEKSDRSDVAILTKYVEDFNLPTTPSGDNNVEALKAMKTKNDILKPIEQIEVVKRGSDLFVVGGRLYKFSTTAVNWTEEYTLDIVQPVNLSSFSWSNIDGNGNLIISPLYSLKAKVVSVDANKRPSEILDLKSGNLTSLIWDLNGSNIVFEAQNAKLSEIAFTSFEDANKGRWEYQNVSISSGGIGGSSSFSLSGGASISTTVAVGANYILSFWVNNSSANIVINGASVISSKSGQTVGDWTFRQLAVRTTTTSLAITGSGKIDELKLIPEGAVTRSLTYQPLLGLEMESDDNGRSKFYSYDNTGRLHLIKDQNGNILKRYCYSYNSAVSSCEVN